MQVDLDYVKENAKSIISPVIFSNLPEGASVKLNKTGEVKAVKKGSSPYQSLNLTVISRILKN